LLDTAQLADAVVHNARALGVDLGKVEAVVLSHNHYDHTGGTIGILKEIGGRVPVVAHPDVLKPSIYIKGTNVRLDIGAPFTRNELLAVGGIPLLVRSSMEVAPGVYFLGEIKRVHPELVPSLEGNYTITDTGEVVEHPLLDDTGIAVAVEGLGAVVITGCGHSGIVNVVEQASRITGMNVYAVLGGFHLVSASRTLIENTVDNLRRLGVEEVHAGHCTGFVAEYMLMEKFGDRFRRIHSGYEATFTAGKFVQ